jgi:hypothetical protein
MLQWEPFRVLSGTRPFAGLVSFRKYPNVARWSSSSALSLIAGWFT